MDMQELIARWRPQRSGGDRRSGGVAVLWVYLELVSPAPSGTVFRG